MMSGMHVHDVHMVCLWYRCGLYVLCACETVWCTDVGISMKLHHRVGLACLWVVYVMVYMWCIVYFVYGCCGICSLWGVCRTYCIVCGIYEVVVWCVSIGV